jgi:hypothetical protein
MMAGKVASRWNLRKVRRMRGTGGCRNAGILPHEMSKKHKKTKVVVVLVKNIKKQRW